MTQQKPEGWIDDLEIENANIKWAFSHFAGEKDLFNKEGDHNFVVILPEPEAKRLYDIGWNVKEKPGREEGDPNEYHLDVKISAQFGMPMIYFIKSGRKFSVDSAAELKQIRRDTCENIDVIIQPSISDKWGVPMAAEVSRLTSRRCMSPSVSRVSARSMMTMRRRDG